MELSHLGLQRSEVGDFELVEGTRGLKVAVTPAALSGRSLPAETFQRRGEKGKGTPQGGQEWGLACLGHVPPQP